MTASNIQITQGSGTRLATNSYSEGGQTVHDEKFIPGEYPYASYIVAAGAVSTATTNSHLIQIMAGSTLNVRLRRIRLRQRTVGTASTMVMQFLRLTTAGTGGGSITPSKFDNADAAAGATAMTLPTGTGTEGATLWFESMPVVASAPTLPGFEWIQHPSSKPIIIPAGTTNGVCIKILSGIATDTVDIDVEITETSF